MTGSWVARLRTVRRAGTTLASAAFCAAFLVVAAGGVVDHVAAASKLREVEVTYVSCLDGFRGSFCVLGWLNDDGVPLRAGLAGAEGVRVGDVVTIAPEYPSEAPEDWAEGASAGEPGGVGRVMLLGPTAVFGDVLLPLMLAAVLALAAAAVWGRWADRASSSSPLNGPRAAR